MRRVAVGTALVARVRVKPGQVRGRVAVGAPRGGRRAVRTVGPVAVVTRGGVAVGAARFLLVTARARGVAQNSAVVGIVARLAVSVATGRGAGLNGVALGARDRRRARLVRRALMALSALIVAGGGIHGAGLGGVAVRAQRLALYHHVVAAVAVGAGGGAGVKRARRALPVAFEARAGGPRERARLLGVRGVAGGARALGRAGMIRFHLVTAGAGGGHLLHGVRGVARVAAGVLARRVFCEREGVRVATFARASLARAEGVRLVAALTARVAGEGGPWIDALRSLAVAAFARSGLFGVVKVVTVEAGVGIGSRAVAGAHLVVTIPARRGLETRLSVRGVTVLAPGVAVRAYRHRLALGLVVAPVARVWRDVPLGSERVAALAAHIARVPVNSALGVLVAVETARLRNERKVPALEIVAVGAGEALGQMTLVTEARAHILPSLRHLGRLLGLTRPQPRDQNGGAGQGRAQARERKHRDEHPLARHSSPVWHSRHGSSWSSRLDEYPGGWGFPPIPPT